jgi:putative chitinase
MLLTLQTVAPATGAGILRAAQWVAPLQGACDQFQINTPLRAAAFLATYGIESARLTALAENMNYSAAGLLVTFTKYFSPADAQAYANQPERIANRAYAGRNGNGDETSGDGWMFRGRGMGITGRRNYLLCSIGIDLDLSNHPELLEDPTNAALASAWYWSNRNLNALADAGNFLGVSKAVNLGSSTSPSTPNNWPERLSLFNAARTAFGI